jgi:phospholipid/cholesterol/gamma-HCH transport system ATP-binding protein
MEPPSFGVLFQSSALFGSSTLLQNVLLPLQKWTRLPPDAATAVAMARLRLVGLARFANHLPSEVSGGMRKRAGIARALALDPPILFFDEPSAGLDPVTAAELDELVLSLARALGVTIVLVTHELPSILHVADRCIMLDRAAGGIIARGSPRDLAERSTDPRVQGFFRRLPAARAT